ncbi:MAG: ATP synthase F1 subunit delta [Candidatus Omnitrophota bacterium]|jgi:F-type H+-transporting ATPase subunit delta
MNDRAVARRYAEGFLAYAKETVGAKAGLEDLMSLGRMLEKDPELLKFLKNPEISNKDKSEFIDKVFKGTFSEETRSFIKLIVEKQRSEEAPDIAQEAGEFYYREMGIERAVIKSAKPLPPEILKAIKEKLENKIGKKLEVEVKIDRSLIGGVQAAVGNIVIDGSIRRKLFELREHLMEIKVD